ncbi:hypothetical protein AB0C27_46450 [Nonomuraea sp. NPDC048882]|uniref:hypothetical protein n=1 Tax=unclassified Nonomuraea TaxID=2593643 RepID=UPI0033D977E1
MYADPPAPKEQGPGETPPGGPLAAPQYFNPDYERLVVAWKAVLPELDALRAALDKAYGLASNPQTWDAPVGERYVKEMREWRMRLSLYRHSVLTAISDEAAGTPRWVKARADAPHAFPA